MTSRDATDHAATHFPPHRTRIKICGITSPELAHVAVASGADAVGLVFAPGSPRHVEFETAVEIVEVLPPFVTAVGLFQLTSRLNEDLEDWWEEWCQLHGEENEDLVDEVADTHRVIRGFRFSRDAVERWNACEAVDALLIDGGAGGTGESFDHAELAAMRNEITKPIILAGGLTPNNVAEAIRNVRPFAVDVSSGVESERGVKSPDLIRAFCAAVREADAALA